MAALPVPIPAVSTDSCGQSLVALGVGLVGLVTGASLFLAGLFLPISPSREIEVPQTFLSRAASVRLGGGQDAPEVTWNPFLHFTAMTQSAIDDRFRLATVNGRNRVTQSGTGVVRSDLKQEASRPRSCLDARAESAHLATVPLCQDPRDALAAMATHYRGAWTRLGGTGAGAAQVAGAVLAAEAAPAAAESVLLVEPVGSQKGRSRIYSRIALRPHARWEVDFDAGRLTLFVQHGRVDLVFDGGSAHVEVDDLLLGKRSDPISPGHRVVLLPGDQLVVSNGQHLRVDNDDVTLAIISVSRLQHAPPSVSIESE